MTKKIYIGNLSFQTTEDQVRELCAPFGKVKSVAMIADRNTGRFRGFCFVEMNKEAADKAIGALDGKEIAGRKIRVNKARSQNKGARSSKSNKSKKRKTSAKEIPLHERTQRGGFGAFEDDFPHTGRGRGRQSGEYRGRDSGNGDFPDSGGSARGNR